MKPEKGFTFIDVMVGTALVLIVFLGIFGIFQLGLKVVSKSKEKIIATALANQRLEEARNLPYQKIGIEGVDENGVLPAIEYYPSDTQKYTILTDVDCRNNPADIGDTCLCDYKTVTVTVSWAGRFLGDVSLATDIAPKNDIQECERQGGVLEASVFDAQGIGIVNAQVQVEDINNGTIEYCITDTNGECAGERGIFLDTSSVDENYKITISKAGYSSEQTFKSGDIYDSKVIATPERPNATILEGQITEKSFSIDILSAFSIETKSSRGKTSFEDNFDNADKISEQSNIVVSNGEVTLAKTNGDYFSSGYLISTDISSPNLQGWEQFSWVESVPAASDIIYQLLYFDTDISEWTLIPNEDLPNNSTGLGPSPVELSTLDCVVYNTLRAKATLSTADLSQTPTLLEWKVSYFTRVANPVTATFTLRGEKLVGKDEAEEPIYKYPPSRHIIVYSGEISDLEWDTYNFSDFSINDEDVELEEGIPGEIQPDGSLTVALSPNTTQLSTLFLSAENTLLVKVKDSETSNPIFSANVRIYNFGLAYDKTQQTNEGGETFFIPLEEATYNLEITAEGYQVYTGQINVLGDTSTTAYLILSPS